MAEINWFFRGLRFKGRKFLIRAIKAEASQAHGYIMRRPVRCPLTRHVKTNGGTRVGPHIPIYWKIPVASPAVTKACVSPSCAAPPGKRCTGGVDTSGRRYRVAIVTPDIGHLLDRVARSFLAQPLDLMPPDGS